MVKRGKEELGISLVELLLSAWSGYLFLNLLSIEFYFLLRILLFWMVVSGFKGIIFLFFYDHRSGYGPVSWLCVRADQNGLGPGTRLILRVARR